MEMCDFWDYRTIMAAVGGTRYAGIDLLLDQIALAFTADAEFGFRWVYWMDVIYAGHCV